MPIYEYACAKCGRRCEVVQKMTDPPLTRCEVCGGTLKKVISPPAIQFKGNGWYITDYARKSSPQTEDKSQEKKASQEVGSCQEGSEKKKPAAPAPKE
jgi:putative FmdB family regulatory protein